MDERTKMIQKESRNGQKERVSVSLRELLKKDKKMNTLIRKLEVQGKNSVKGRVKRREEKSMSQSKARERETETEREQKIKNWLII